MKVVKPKVSPATRVGRVRGVVIVDARTDAIYMEVGRTSLVHSVVNLETGELLDVGSVRDGSDVAYPHAALLLDGAQTVVAIPPFKSAEQHAQEFLKWGYDNPNKSQFSQVTVYTPSEVIEGRTNASIRRQWQTWLAARGV